MRSVLKGGAAGGVPHIIWEPLFLPLTSRMPAMEVALGGGAGSVGGEGFYQQQTPTLETKARHTDNLIWTIAQQLRHVSIKQLAGRLPPDTCNMEFSGDLPANRNLVKIEKLPYVPKTALERAGLETSIADRTGKVYDDKKANEELVFERLNNRDELAKLPSAWGDVNGLWWQPIAHTKSNNRCLAVQFMELYRQAVNYHFTNAGNRDAAAVDFDTIWRRMVEHRPYKATRVMDIICMTGVKFPIFTANGDRHDVTHRYLASPPIADWVRHPTLIDLSLQARQLSEPKLKKPSSFKFWKRPVPHVDVDSANRMLERLVNVYEADDQVYSLFSWRFAHLRAEGLSNFSETNLLNHSEFGESLKDLSIVSHLDPESVVDLSFLPRLMGKQTQDAEAILLDLAHNVDSEVTKLLDKAVLCDESNVRAIFDSQKLPALQRANAELQQWFDARVANQSSRQLKFAFRVIVSRAVHKWFEMRYVPSVMQHEPMLDSIELPLENPTHGDRQAAYVFDIMTRMDTSEIAAMVAKYFLNEPNPASKVGNKQQSCRFLFNPNGPHSLLKAHNVKTTTLPAYDVFNDAPAFHIAYHVKEADNRSYVMMPGFQEMYTRFDEINTSSDQHAFIGHTAHMGLNKQAQDVRDVYSLHTLTPRRIDAIRQEAKALVVGLKKGYNTKAQNRGEEYDDYDEYEDLQALDDEEVASKLVQASFKRHPLLKELECISLLNDPFLEKGLVSKGIYEILGNGFFLSTPPEHIRVHRSKPQSKKKTF